MLVRRSHALLTDEILVAVYNMAIVDLDSFYDGLIGHFLGSAFGNTVTEQQRAQLTDIFSRREQVHYISIVISFTLICIFIWHISSNKLIHL